MTAAQRIEQISRWLRILVAPGQLTELRAIGDGRCESLSFDGGHLDDMARAALVAEKWARGVYFVPNPLKPEARGRPAKDADVLSRRWLLIDVDPVRPANTPATKEQREAAWEVLCRCQDVLETAEFAKSLVGFSGNGWHLCQPVQLANDAAARETCKKLLQQLARRCGDEKAKVDTTTYNAARIWKLYGTLAKKGEATAANPHRYSKLIEV